MSSCSIKHAPGVGVGYAPDLGFVLEGFGFENVTCSTNWRDFNNQFSKRYCFVQIRQQMRPKLCALYYMVIAFVISYATTWSATYRTCPLADRFSMTTSK